MSTYQVQLSTSKPGYSDEMVKQWLDSQASKHFKYNGSTNILYPQLNYENKIICKEYNVPSYKAPSFQEICQNWCATKLNTWMTPMSRNAFIQGNSDEGSSRYINLELDRLTLGALSGLNGFIVHKDLTAQCCKVNFENLTGQVALTLKYNYFSYRLTLRYLDIQYLIVHNTTHESGIVIETPSPLRIMQTMIGENITENTEWLRVSSIPGLCDQYSIGATSAIMLSFTQRNILQEILGNLVYTQGFLGYIHFAYIDTSTPTSMLDVSNICADSFDVQYAFDALVRKGYKVRSQINKKFTDIVKRLSEEDEKSLIGALYELSNAIDDQRFLQLDVALPQVYENESRKTAEEIPNGCRKVRKIICTPTRIILLPPELIMENRVLRQYGEEYAIRVSFRDDDYCKLSQAFDDSSVEFYDNTICKPMKQGIVIGSRHYKFFAWSNSQLSDHGCWIYAKDNKGNTAESIRMAIGDLEVLRCEGRCVARYMARLGQCFSQTKESVKVSIDDNIIVEKISDIERWNSVTNETYCFSDGIGKISLELRDEVCDALGVEHYIPCAFQIRFRGCKGMVAVDSGLEGKALCIRGSMEKFQSSHTSLEVVKYSQPGKLYLNRNAITLLSQLGVPNSAFLHLQEKTLHMMADSLIYEDGALNQLRNNVHIGKDFKRLAHCGISLNRDVFFHGMLDIIGRSIFGNLRRRARIELPFGTSRNMFGVLDECSVLKEGQVFIQYSENFREEIPSFKTVQGTVVVTKNPCMHPGDVRKFQAISDIPKECPIWLLYDVIVFPQKGRRPHPNQMAGSDLDGDEYFVTWNPDLIFEEENKVPMEFPSAEKQKINHPIEESDMIDFLKRFIMNDRKGVIANAHMVHADNLGIYSDKCLKIAKKYSFAVDFQKTGTCPKLDQDEIPLQYPDFMGKRDKTTYYSSKVLGNLFRICREVENVIPRKQKRRLQHLQLEECRDADLFTHDLEIINDVAFNKAKKSQKKYNSYLQSILTQYGIDSEAEAVSGCILRLHKRLMEKEDTRETEQIIRLRMKNLWKKTRKDFFEEFGGEKALLEAGGGDFPEAVYDKAKSWYTVTYTQKDAILVSFPWVLWDIFCKIKIKAWALTGSRQNVQASLLTHMSDRLLSAYTESYAANMKDSIMRNVKSYQTRQIVLTYMKAYPELLILFCTLINWAKKPKVAILSDGLYQSNTVTEAVICLLVIDIGVNKELLCGVGPDSVIHTESRHCNIAELCFEVLKYIGSQNFQEQNSCSLTIVSDVHLQNSQINNLSKKSRRAYHAIAQTGDIGVLTGLYEENTETRLISDSGPVPVGLARFLTHSKYKNYHYDKIRQTTGVDRLSISLYSPTGRPQGFVESTGSPESIDKLRRLITGWLTKKKANNKWSDFINEDYI